MGRHNKATKERKAKAKAREENKPVETSIKDAVVKPSAPAMAAEVSATSSTSVEAKSKAAEFVQTIEDQRPQEIVRGNGTANGSCLINERGKESGRANEAMKTKGAPRGWSQLASGDLPKFEEAFREQPSKLDGLQKPRVEDSNPAENSVYSGGNSKFGEEASSVARLQPSNLEGFQKPRVEGSNPAKNNVYGGGCFKIGEVEVSSVVTLRPSKFEARQNPRVEGSNPVENRGNGVGYSAQSQSGDFRKAGNVRGVLRGGYGRVETRRVEGSNSVENKVNGVGYSSQSHSRDLRTTDNGRGSIRGGYGHQASESQVDEFTRIDSLGRLLSSILRHQAAELGLDIRSDGYVFVKDLLKLRRRTHAGFPLSSHSVDDIKEAVKMDKKQRFGLLEENGQLLIRANQGHSIQIIKSEDLLSAVCSVEEVPVCVHGTYLRNLDSIQKEGLKRMGRNHVHFAPGLLKEKSVISGMRSDCEVLIHLDVQMYLKDGMKLYRSENGVILAEGKNGVIPPNYFANIQRLRS